MRAARTAQVWQWPARHAVPGQDAGTPAHTAGPRAGASLGLRPVLGLAALFLAGYVGGILYCRGSVPEPAALLAGFYMDKQNFADFGAVFASLFSAAFLQMTAAALCGSSVIGPAPLAVLFAGRGTMLGLCAAAVYASSGARGLVVYWLLSFLPELSFLLLLLWLSQAACRLSGALFGVLMGRNPARGALKIKAKTMVFRYLFAIAASAACAVLGAGSAVLFAGVLL